MALIPPVPVALFNVFLVNAAPKTTADKVLTGVTAALDTGRPFLSGSFQKVEGLTYEMQTEDYQEGGWNSASHRFVKRGNQPQNIALHKGVTPDAGLWDWFYGNTFKRDSPLRKNGLVILNYAGTPWSSVPGAGTPFLDRMPAGIWFFRNALPVKVTLPALDAQAGSAAAVETVELAHEGLYRLSLGMLPGIAGQIASAVGV